MYQRLSATIAPVPPPSAGELGRSAVDGSLRFEESRRSGGAASSPAPPTWTSSSRGLPPSLGGPGSRPLSSRK
jgi:hypothetical protein